MMISLNLQRLWSTLAILVVALVPMTTLAEIQPVSARNSDKCITYLTINGKMACSNQAIATSPSLKQGLSNEHSNFSFDDRTWKLGWWNENPQQPMLEYVFGSETVNTWSELVTSQYFPGLQTKLTPEQFMKIMLLEMIKRGFQPKVRVISQSSNSILYEWRIDNHPSENQDELQRIMADAKGLYVIHYASRPTMSEDKRKAWIKLLSLAKTKH